ncbi:hypothetical protein [Ovoidimarina sediminis]|uniref:hypothetical protein n=1 Tax=Ovoidimarina sediminis TaxID=3079856 RepID=UPI00290AB933|nr:hypothetical protein [Rhodophyticola sp. MJ-SS7]MDU8946348.1 hypothetical protein [Rhodophyticola sp. MJ-SS7]
MREIYMIQLENRYERGEQPEHHKRLHPYLPRKRAMSAPNVRLLALMAVAVVLVGPWLTG